MKPTSHTTDVIRGLSLSSSDCQLSYDTPPKCNSGSSQELHRIPMTVISLIDEIVKCTLKPSIVGEVDGRDIPISFDKKKYDILTGTGEQNSYTYYVPVSRYRIEPISNTKLSPIHIAAFGGSLELVEAYVRSKKVDLKARTGEGRTPLHLAVEARSITKVRLLLDSPEAKGCVDAKDSDGWTPIHVASRFGEKDIVSLLLDAGADIDVQTASRSCNYSVLHIAIAYDHDHLASFLLSKSPSLTNCSASGANGWLPLHEATKRNNYQIAQELILKGAWINESGMFSCTINEQSWLSGKILSLQPLEISLIVAFMNSRLFKNSQDTKKFHPFPIIKLLLENGATFSKFQDDQSLVHLAAKSPYDDFLRLILENKREVIDTTDNRGSTPLHYAVFRERERCVRVLLEFGARTETLNSNGYNALHAAILRGNITIMEMLLNCGADPNARDSKGQTPLHLASFLKKGGVVSLLMEHGADVNAVILDNFPTPASIEEKFTELSTLSEGLTPIEWAHDSLSSRSTKREKTSISSPKINVLTPPSIADHISNSRSATRSPSPKSPSKLTKTAIASRPTSNNYHCRYENCNHSFTDRHNRNRHERFIHAYKDSKPSFICEVPGCRKVFTRADNMLKHLRKHHSDMTISKPPRKRLRVAAQENDVEQSI